MVFASLFCWFSGELDGERGNEWEKGEKGREPEQSGHHLVWVFGFGVLVFGFWAGRGVCVMVLGCRHFLCTGAIKRGWMIL